MNTHLERCIQRCAASCHLFYHSINPFHTQRIKKLNLIYASARFKDLFLKSSVPVFSSQPTFFWSDLCPIRVYEPFPTAKQTDGKGEIRKILKGKNVGKARASSLFFLKQRLWRNFSFSPHIRNLPIEKGFHGLGIDFPKTGEQEKKEKSGTEWSKKQLAMNIHGKSTDFFHFK